MGDTNPYQTPDDDAPNVHASAKSISPARCALTGFIVGSSLPFAWGMYGMQQHYAYLYSLPPNEAACGTGALGSVALIILVGPLCGLIGGASAWSAARLRSGRSLSS